MVSLQLVDPRYYHLDTALFVLRKGESAQIAYYPEAFSEGSRRVLRRMFPDAVVADEADAACLGLNGVSDGRNVVLPLEATGLAERIEERGYEPVLLDIESTDASTLAGQLEGADAAVFAALVVWWLIGGMTADDGYFLTMAQVRDDLGYVTDYYRWFSGTVAPMGWFVELQARWVAVSTATPWIRLPALGMGLLSWVLISRYVQPRLGQRVRRSRAAGWAAAAPRATVFCSATCRMTTRNGG